MDTSIRTELLIYGYIRSIERILEENVIIPLELFTACSAFYSVSLRLIITTSDPKIYIANITDKKMSALKDANLRVLSSCFIPNISQYIDINNKSNDFDGIIGICRANNNYFEMNEEDHVNANPFVLLFDSDNRDNDIIDYDLYISSASVSKFSSYTFPYLTLCDKHGVIYSNHGLYQLKWKDIDIHSKQFNFTSFGPRNKTTNNFGSVGYIENTQKLFVMEGFVDKGPMWYYFAIKITPNGADVNKNYHKQCGILDLNTNQLIDIKRFHHERHSQVFQAGICENNNYETNVIYIVSNIGYTAKYDLNKNEWEMILDDVANNKILCERKPVVWMDDNPHILYCYGNQSNFGYLDLRENKREWNASNDINQFVFGKTESPFISVSL